MVPRSLRPYAHGAGSQNFQLITLDGEDFTVCLDLRRSLESVRLDRPYIEAVSQAGVLAPKGPWVDGEIAGRPITIRPTIPGTVLIDMPNVQPAILQLLGASLATVHQVRVANLPKRPYFYRLLLSDSDDRWELLQQWARPRVDQEDELSQLLHRGWELLNRMKSERTSLRECPIGLIHGDVTLKNILVTDTGGVAILDWEKACSGARPSDLAQALFHVCGYWDDPWKRADALIRGYFSTSETLVSRRMVVSWLDAYAAGYFLTDAAFAARNQADREHFNPSRERYFLDYCIPVFRRYCRHSRQIKELLADDH